MRFIRSVLAMSVIALAVSLVSAQSGGIEVKVVDGYLVAHMSHSSPPTCH